MKRGWWHSEFNRFRYDVWLVLGSKPERTPRRLLGLRFTCGTRFEIVDYSTVCKELQLSERGEDNVSLVDPRLVERLQGWVSGRAAGAHGLDGFVVTLPNARTYAATKLVEWLEHAANQGLEMSSLPGLPLG